MKNMKPIYWIIIIVIAALIAAVIILSRKEKEKDETAQEAEAPETPVKAIESAEPAEEIPVRELESTAEEPSPLEIEGEINPPETRMTEEYIEFLEEQEAQKKDS